jgi:diguanylate cyclase (GGDEF)-like protein
MVFRRRPFQPGVFLAAAGIAALIMVTIVVVPQWLAQRARLEVLRLHVAEVAQLAASTVDGDLHRQLLDPANYSPGLYGRALEPLVRFHSAIPDVFYVYTMVDRQGETFFVLDTSVSPALTSKHKLRASAYMERFRLRAEYSSDWLTQIGSGQTWVTPTFQLDDYGYFLTGHAPIKDSQGRYSGFVGVDFDLGYYMAQEKRFRNIGIGSLAAVALVALLIGFLVARYHFDLQHQMRRHYDSSIRDELTGLLNRRGALDAVSRIPTDPQSAHAALLVDIDGLKAINDTRGHAAGDAAITRLAATIRATVRGDAIAARIGGDEFLIVAPRCDGQAAAKIAAQIIDHLAIPAGNEPACSVSVGISIETGTADFDGMYRRADEALYRAKADGKNRSVIYGRGNREA